MKNKENTLNDFLEIIKNAWTYDKMTKEEQNRLFEVMNSVRINKSLKGNYNHRWDILNGLYYAFLIGIGYDNFHWREV